MHATGATTPPTVALLEPESVAWLYGALLDRTAVRGQPRDPAVRRELSALRATLVFVLADDLVAAEVDAAGALETQWHCEL
jgi:hypothetical protein